MMQGVTVAVQRSLHSALLSLFALGALLLPALALAESASRWESLPWGDRIGASWFESQAEAGDANAQYRLGEIYEAGLGDTESDEALAIAWYGKAAEQGHARAAFRLGRLLERQSGQAEAAAAAYRQASRAGLPEATYNLARLHRDGVGVERNLRRAGELYRQAYADGLSRATLDLAQLALVGVERDEVVALAWALRAEEEGVPGAAAFAERLKVLLAPEAQEAAVRLSGDLPRP